MAYTCGARGNSQVGEDADVRLLRDVGAEPAVRVPLPRVVAPDIRQPEQIPVLAVQQQNMIAQDMPMVNSERGIYHLAGADWDLSDGLALSGDNGVRERNDVVLSGL